LAVNSRVLATVADSPGPLEIFNLKVASVSEDEWQLLNKPALVVVNLDDGALSVADQQHEAFV
jgi:hypothetical protein